MKTNLFFIIIYLVISINAVADNDSQVLVPSDIKCNTNNQCSLSNPDQEVHLIATQPQLSEGPLKLDTVTKLTLVNSYTIQWQSLQAEVTKATHQYQRSFFDPTTTATIKNYQYRPYGYQGSTDTDNQSLTLGVEQRFRNGISTNFSVSVYRDVPMESNTRKVNMNSSAIKFSLIVPLLKGFGYTSANALETSAQYNADAAIQNYYNAISQTILNSVKAYWDYKAAVENLKTYQISQQRILGWTEFIRKVSQANTAKFAPQLARLQAFLAEKERQVISATDWVNQTKYTLGISMGITPDQVNKIGEPVDGQLNDFPMNFSIDKEYATQKWVAIALEKRFNLQAAKLTEQAAAAMLAKARQDILPKVDLELSTGQSNLNYANNAYNNYTMRTHDLNDNHGAEATISLNFSYPLGNNNAQSVLNSAIATHQQNLIWVNEVMRNTRLEVIQSIGSLINNLRTVVKTQEVVTNGYEPALAEYEKSQPNLVTEPNALFTLMDIEKDLVVATINRNLAVLELAKMIVTLRHQTGVLIEVDPSTNIASLKNVTKLPDL